MSKILVGIILYNPEINRLQENINSIKPQTDKIVFIDNGSSNIDIVNKILPDNSILLRNEKNVGIATALNQILQYALNNDYDWVLTLDQDSVVSNNIIKVYKECIFISNDIGMISCKIKDRNANLSINIKEKEIDGYISQCITSASMLRVQAWKEIGGFDDNMFIDSVDFDICINLRKHGWKIFRTFKTEILHEVGHSKVIKIFRKEYLSLNHAPFRYYYIARNNIYLGRKYGMLLHNMRVIIRMIWTILRYEEKKIIKIIKITKGIIDGFYCPITNSLERKKDE